MWCFLQSSTNEELFKVIVYIWRQSTWNPLCYFGEQMKTSKEIVPTHVNVNILSYGKFECQKNYFGTSPLFKKRICNY